MPLSLRPSVLAPLLLLAPLAARAQYPANTQIGPVDNRVGGELYGRQNTTRYPVPNQIRLLPSEERYAIWRSGTLRSEYEMNRAAYGPLPPEGLLNYVTRRSPLQQALNVSQPQLINPAYDPDRIPRPNASGDLTPTGFPRNAQEGLNATTRTPGARPNVPNQRPDSAKPLPNPLPPIEPPTGPAETEPGRTVPVQQAPSRPANPSGTGESARPAQVAIPSLTGAPDVPLPTGQLGKNVSYDPNATRASMLIARPPLPRK
jgi:hypothetical protein